MVERAEVDEVERTARAQIQRVHKRVEEARRLIELTQLHRDQSLHRIQSSMRVQRRVR